MLHTERGGPYRTPPTGKGSSKQRRGERNSQSPELSTGITQLRKDRGGFVGQVRLSLDKGRPARKSLDGRLVLLHEDRDLVGGGQVKAWPDR